MLWEVRWSMVELDSPYAFYTQIVLKHYHTTNSRSWYNRLGKHSAVDYRQKVRRSFTCILTAKNKCIMKLPNGEIGAEHILRTWPGMRKTTAAITSPTFTRTVYDSILVLYAPKIGCTVLGILRSKHPTHSPSYSRARINAKDVLVYLRDVHTWGG